MELGVKAVQIDCFSTLKTGKAIYDSIKWLWCVEKYSEDLFNCVKSTLTNTNLINEPD
jgi:hypothetical protein